MMRAARVLLICIAPQVLGACGAPASNKPAPAAPASEWPAYRGGYESINYSSLAQIDRSNVKDLQVAWTLDTGDAYVGSQMECNPIVIGGVIYLTSPKMNVIAADAATGKQIWRFDPNQGRHILGKFRSRGLTYWADGADQRIFVGVRQYLYALDARTGKPVPSFGNAGRIDLRENLDRDPATQSVQLGSPAVIYRDTMIVGSSTHASNGDIRAYDARTGALRWTFHTIPRPGEFGYETWPKDLWKQAIKANNWGGMSLDVDRGIVYVPTAWAWARASLDIHGYYGGDRAGDNLFANTLLALDAATGKRLWHFQFVRHDTWDRDLPTAPSLVTVTRNGRRIDAVAQPTKAGQLFVFDRVSGEPLFPIEARKVPASDVAGEVLAATQPFPVRPRPFTRQAFTEDMITDRTPAAHAAVLERFRKLKSGGQYVPMSEQGTLVFPGLEGGALWGGAAYDPQTGLLYINANEVPWVLRLEKQRPAPRTSGNSARDIYLRECASCHGENKAGSAGVPSLVSLGERTDVSDVRSFIAEGSEKMPGFNRLGSEALNAVAAYLVAGNDVAVGRVSTATSAIALSPYKLAEVEMLHDPDGYPGIKPPWGTLSAIDLNSGEYVWQIPLGEYPELAAAGVRNTGSQNAGGAVVTAGGLVFIGATVFDRKFRAFDKKTGELLWETTLPASAHATPTVYEAGGRQFVVIAAGGGKAATEYQRGDVRDDSRATYIAFALPRR